jgi:hypothetical protein
MVYFGNTLDNFHEKVVENITVLRAQRGDNPVYAIEHGLQSNETDEMFNAVGAAVRQFGISKWWWKGRSLPLLVAAAEVGYEYRGTGTNFWPKLEQRFGAGIAANDRANLSILFDEAHSNFGIKRPVASRWTKAFRHIAWPIANAVVPKELHRPLASALRQAMLVSSSQQPDNELAHQLARAASRVNSERLVEWVVDSELATAILYHLLEVPDPFLRLSGPAIIRILGDLGKDAEAASNVRQALGLSKAIRPIPDKAPTRVPLATLALRFAQGDEPKLFVKMPALPESLRIGIMDALVTEGLRPWLWGSAGPFKPDYLLSGLDLPIDDSNLAESINRSAPFLHFDEETLVRHPGLRLLAAMGPTLSQTLVFRSVDIGKVLELSDVSDVVEGDIVHVLTIEEVAICEGISACGQMCGLFHYSLDLAEMPAANWLATRGWQRHSRPLARLAGGVVVGQELAGPVFSSQMPVLVVPADGKLQFESSGIQIQSIDVPSGSLVLVEPSKGAHVLSAMSKGVTNQLRFQISDERRDCDTLTMLCQPATPSINDVLNRHLSFYICVPFPTEKTDVTVSLSSAAGELATVRESIDELPCTIGSSHRLLQELAEQLDEVALPREGSFLLKVKVGKNWVQSWQLAWQATAVSWEIVDGKWSALADSEPLELETRLASRPMAPNSSTDATNFGGEFRLLIPLIDGQAQMSDALCIGPDVTTLDRVKIEMPRFWVREVAGRGQFAGLDDTLDAYLMWKLARPESLLSFINARRVAADLESLLVKILCGEFWIKKENRNPFLSGDGWSALASTAISQGVAKGDNLPEIEPKNELRFRRILAGRMRMGAACSWETTPSMDVEEFAEIMDSAVVEAHEEFESSRHLNNNTELFDYDIYNPPESWQEALVNAHKGIRNEFLTKFLLPADRAQRLLAADYSMLMPDELALLIERSHTDLAPRNAARWLSSDDLRLALELWIDPRKLVTTPDWRISIHRLLDDRQTARAVRYAALRFSAAQGIFQDGAA